MSFAPGLGYGGSAYSFSPYESTGFPLTPVSTDEGYGRYEYGLSSYGSADIDPPRVSGASSLDGHHIEIYFSEAVRYDAALQDVSSYTITPVLGAPATVEEVTVTLWEGQGVTALILHHTGTTLGGRYTVTVNGLVDIAGNPIEALVNSASVLTLGEIPTFTVSVVDSDTLEVDFNYEVIPETDHSPGVESVSSYSVTTDYPVPLTVLSAEHIVDSDASKVRLEVYGQTSATYDLEISPADAIEYDGTILPSAATDFSGVVVGTGTSTATPSNGLRLTKSAGFQYGWSFLDTSGRLVPGTSYRADIRFNAASAAFSTVLTDAVLGTYVVSDGAVQVNIVLNRIATVEVLEVTSGSYSVTIPHNWSESETTISVLRNEVADFYSILVDGVPQATALRTAYTGSPTIAAGVQFVLDTTYGISQFPIYEVTVTSSQTIFSTAWNFLHGVSDTFVGSADSTRSVIQTERGPLVKSWGDATPATIQDITVRVNDVEIELDDVNPYLGQITPAIPIPLMDPGDMTVEVDYHWFPNPVMEIVELNNPGLVLNKWDHRSGNHKTSLGSSTSGGVPDTMRFQMGLVLGPMEHRAPVLIGHRYIGFERAYTAALNSPTTLLLNRDPHRISLLDMSRTPEQVTVSYDGTVAPDEATQEWTLSGTDTGEANDDGTYTIVDANSASYGTADAAVYSREEDLSFPSTVNYAIRVQVDDYEADGVFTGVGFGLHDNYRLYLAGLLDVNGVRHVGLLTNPSRPNELASWEIGPSVDITITSSVTFEVPTALWPTSIEEGTRIQILSGTQAGVYTIDDCGIHVGDDGTTTVTLDSGSTFPEDPALDGNSEATIYFEVLWNENPTTFRMVVDPEGRAGQLYLGGSSSGLVAEIEDSPTYPAYTSLLLPTGDQGAFFMGSLSYLATSTSTWSLARYGISPDTTTQHAQGIVVAAEMTVLPENDANNEWFLTNEFGLSEIDSTGTRMVLKSTAASDTLDLTYGYERIEPFLTPKVRTSVDAAFRVESGVLGAGDAQIVVRDTVREVRLATLLFEETVGGNALINLGSVSLSGLYTPEAQGWEAATGNTITVSARDNLITVTQVIGEEGTWFTTLPATTSAIDDSSLDEGGRIIEARLAITSHTANASNYVGVIFGTDAVVGGTGYVVALTFRAGATPKVVLTSDGSSLVEYSFDWTDGEPHWYRLIADPDSDTVSVTVDDTVLGTAALSTLFDVSPTEDTAFLGTFGTDSASVVEWDAFSVSTAPPAAAQRTLGVYLGGDIDDIDSYRIPRNEGMFPTIRNSDPAANIEKMDWTSLIELRLHRDPDWGVSVFRPDLAAPPYFDGDFVTDVTEPTAAWINVEYRQLPRSTTTFGTVAFGALDKRSVTQQRWSDVAYRIYQYSEEDLISPHHMVLNQYNVIHSGEYNLDTTPEVVEVTSLSSTLVSLAPTHMYADRVFNVVVDGSVLASSSWSFNQDAQAIFLSVPLASDHELVTVTFAPSKPVTNTYLENQPLRDSVTLLNEGTPPIPKHQIGQFVRTEIFGSTVSDPNDAADVDADEVDNTSYRSLSYSDPEGTYYEDMEFIELDDGGLTGVLSSIGDGPAAEEGLIEIGLSGFRDAPTTVGGPGEHAGTPMIKGQDLAHLSPFVLGGGVRSGVGVLGAAIFYPNYSPEPVVAGTDTGNVNMDYNVHMTLTAVSTDGSNDVALEDTYSFPTGADNTPPSLPTGELNEPNPDGTPAASGNGACIAVLSDGAGLYSRLGPWGGLASLNTNSLLGGGAPADSTGMVLGGGAAIDEPSETIINVVAAN